MRTFVVPKNRRLWTAEHDVRRRANGTNESAKG